MAGATAAQGDGSFPCVCGGGQRGRTVAHLLRLSIVISKVGGVRASAPLPVRNVLHSQSHRFKMISLTVHNNVAHRKKKGEPHHNVSTNNMLQSGSTPLCLLAEAFGRRFVAVFSALPRDSSPAVAV